MKPLTPEQLIRSLADLDDVAKALGPKTPPEIALHRGAIEDDYLDLVSPDVTQDCGWNYHACIGQDVVMEPTTISPSTDGKAIAYTGCTDSTITVLSVDGTCLRSIPIGLNIATSIVVSADRTMTICDRENARLLLLSPDESLKETHTVGELLGAQYRTHRPYAAIQDNSVLYVLAKNPAHCDPVIFCAKDCGPQEGTDIVPFEEQGDPRCIGFAQGKLIVATANPAELFMVTPGNGMTQPLFRDPLNLAPLAMVVNDHTITLLSAKTLTTVQLATGHSITIPLGPLLKTKRALAACACMLGESLLIGDEALHCIHILSPKHLSP